MTEKLISAKKVIVVGNGGIALELVHSVRVSIRVGVKVRVRV
jgi:hypothetical protein